MTHNPKYVKDLEKIKAICDAYKGGNGDGEGTPGGSGEDDDEGEREGRRRGKPAAGEKALQEAQAENGRLKREAAVRVLCDAAKFVPTPVQLKSLTNPQLSDDEVKTLVEGLKAAPEVVGGKPVQKPVSQGAGWKPEPHPGATPVQEARQGETDDQRRARRVREMKAGK